MTYVIDRVFLVVVSLMKVTFLKYQNIYGLWNFGQWLDCTFVHSKFPSADK